MFRYNPDLPLQKFLQLPGRNRMRTTARLLLVLALAGPAVLVDSGAMAADPQKRDLLAAAERLVTSGKVKDVADTRNLGNAPLVTGVIVVGSDNTPAAHAAVVLSAWPSEETVAAMKPGDRAQLIPIGKAIADEKGQYTLRVDPKIKLDRLVSKAGRIDMQVTALTSTSRAVEAFSVAVAGRANLTEDALLARIDLRNKSAERAHSATLRLESHPTLAKVGAPASVEPFDVGTQDVTLVMSYGLRWVTVGTGYTYTAGVTYKYNYSSSASSSLAQGVSASGTYGSFSAGSSITRSSSGQVGFPTMGDFSNTAFQTQYEYGLYRETAGVCPLCTVTYYARAIQWAGGAQTVWQSSVTANYCVWHGTGTDFTKSTTTATEQSTGAKTGGAIGIDLSVRTGYTSSANIYFNFNTGRYLCGQSNYPINSPGQLAAKANG